MKQWMYEYMYFKQPEMDQNSKFWNIVANNTDFESPEAAAFEYGWKMAIIYVQEQLKKFEEEIMV